MGRLSETKIANNLGFNIKFDHPVVGQFKCLEFEANGIADMTPHNRAVSADS